jgi:heme/copper-type cytochrome/quinol oxidase subunit 2
MDMVSEIVKLFNLLGHEVFINKRQIVDLFVVYLVARLIIFAKMNFVIRIYSYFSLIGLGLLFLIRFLSVYYQRMGEQGRFLNNATIILSVLIISIIIIMAVYIYFRHSKNRGEPSAPIHRFSKVVLKKKISFLAIEFFSVILLSFLIYKFY